MKSADEHADLSRARIFLANGEVRSYENEELAHMVWLCTPEDERLAFRGKGDSRPVLVVKGNNDEPY